MSKVIEMVGQKVGRLKIIKRAGSNPQGKARWLCKCDCGKEKIVSGDKLRRGDTKSCSCLQRENFRNHRILEYGLASMRALISNYKGWARKRNLKWDLTEEQFKELTQKDCHYCGAKPSNLVKNVCYNGDYIYNGLDRMDNNKGYTIDNVISCCRFCNYAKNKHTLEGFKDWIKRVYKKTIGETNA